jgi:hypothetical protein
MNWNIRRCEKKLFPQLPDGLFWIQSFFQDCSQSSPQQDKAL